MEKEKLIWSKEVVTLVDRQNKEIKSRYNYASGYVVNEKGTRLFPYKESDWHFLVQYVQDYTNNGDGITVGDYVVKGGSNVSSYIKVSLICDGLLILMGCFVIFFGLISPLMYNNSGIIEWCIAVGVAACGFFLCYLGKSDLDWYNGNKENRKQNIIL